MEGTEESYEVLRVACSRPKLEPVTTRSIVAWAIEFVHNMKNYLLSQL
jgi:hypothetical protein